MPSHANSIAHSRLADLIHHAEFALAGLSRLTAPWADLLIRFSLAQAFWVSGILKLRDWDTALNLARYEYPVPFMDPTTAAYLGVVIELLAPMLLLLGLATRFAALSLFVLTLVMQSYYLALDTHLFWMFTLAAYCLRGAGSLSLDAALDQGIKHIPLPFVASIHQGFQTLRQAYAPRHIDVLRVWLAAGLVLAAYAAAPADWPWLPLKSYEAMPAGPSLIIAAGLFLGLGTRVAALALIVLVIHLGMAGQASIHLGWLLPQLMLLALTGGGALTLDTLLRGSLERRIPGLAPMTDTALAKLPHVVIVGAGFGGIACAKGLRHAPVRVTIIDRHNYHLFQPLLYQVATAGLTPSDIATPIREVFREQRNVTVLLGTVQAVDSAERVIKIGEPDQTLHYDYLVIATGASHSYFGRDEWARFAPGLKRIEDAADVRRRILLAFEHAEASEDAAEQHAQMTFIIVGGGPTGVELAGAIAELARFGMQRDFRRIDPREAKVILVQSAPRLLPSFSEALSQEAQRALEALGVEVRTGSRVTSITAQGAEVDRLHLEARTVLWAAGVMASPAATWLGAQADKAGRIVVDEHLAVPGHAGVYAIGDTAASLAWRGELVPGLAPAAKQAGQYVARVVIARVLESTTPAPFRYQHLGSLATIGRKAAVADFGFIRISGALAWWLWGGIHVFFLVGMRNRISVIWDWVWAYLTFRSGTRLITDQS